jgi:hypothetical protein
MLTRNGEGMELLANLVVFAMFGDLAFVRNDLGLFDDSDGWKMFVELLNRLTPPQPSLAFANDLLQSIGNIQFLQNSWPLFLTNVAAVREEIGAQRSRKTSWGSQVDHSKRRLGEGAIRISIR